jgi:hypothetical protein
MRNVTVTMDEDTAAWARVEAAKQGKSLSRYLVDLVEAARGRKHRQREAMEAFLAGPLLDLTDGTGKAPGREEIYDRARVRGHQRADLRKGPEERGKA